jgi:hypothetical protein
VSIDTSAPLATGGSNGALDARDLFARRDRLGARTGGLAADVDDVGSFSQRARPRDSAID